MPEENQKCDIAVGNMIYKDTANCDIYRFFRVLGIYKKFIRIIEMRRDITIVDGICNVKCTEDTIGCDRLVPIYKYNYRYGKLFYPDELIYSYKI
jgi:hypothetical protein